MSGGMKNAERQSQGKKLPERNVYKKRTRANQEQYMQARKEANKVCKEKRSNG
jgi:hypothetical protein